MAFGCRFPDECFNEHRIASMRYTKSSLLTTAIRVLHRVAGRFAQPAPSSVLMVVTSRNMLGDAGRETGVWLEEFLVPYYAFIDADISVRLASPRGGPIPIDPLSIEEIRDTLLYKRLLQDDDLLTEMQQAEALETVSPEAIDAVLYAGGIGSLFDLRNDEDSIRIMQAMYSAGRPIAAICHSGCVLLEAKKLSGEPLVRGRHVTAYSDSEGAAVQFEGVAPYRVETELRKLGANYSRADDWQEHCVVDGLLITGQNPASSAAVAKEVINFMKVNSTFTA
jgi:putative intracellular protease/amidase